MIWKIVSGVIAVALVLMYVGPVVLRVGEPALVVVVLVGLGLMLLDLWHTLRSED